MFFLEVLLIVEHIATHLLTFFWKDSRIYWPICVLAVRSIIVGRTPSRCRQEDWGKASPVALPPGPAEDITGGKDALARVLHRVLSEHYSGGPSGAEPRRTGPGG
jgi:hypothetical protein